MEMETRSIEGSDSEERGRRIDGWTVGVEEEDEDDELFVVGGGAAFFFFFSRFFVLLGVASLPFPFFFPRRDFVNCKDSSLESIVSLSLLITSSDDVIDSPCEE